MSFAALGIAGGTAAAGALGLGTAGTIGLGAAGGVAGGLLGGGLGGLFGGGGGGSKQRISNLNPAGFTLADVFGLGYSSSRGWTPRGYNRYHGITSDPTRNAFSGLQGDVRSFIEAIPQLSTAEQFLQSNILGSDTFLPGILGSSMDLMDLAAGSAGEGALTGFAVDPAPLFNEAIRRFGAEALPQVAETAGLGLHSSGFRELAGREASNLLGQAATQGVQLQNDAAQRRLMSLPVAAQLAAGRMALPTGFASDVLGLGQQFRLEEERFARRPIDTFLQLAGIGNQLPYLQQGFPTQDSTSDLIGALGSTLPFLISAIPGGGKAA